jgi:hypothetical protein
MGNDEREEDLKGFPKVPEFNMLTVPLGVLQSHFIPIFQQEGNEEEKTQAVLELTKGSFSSPIKILGNSMEEIDFLPPLIEGSPNNINYGRLLSDAELKDRHIPESGSNMVKRIVSKEEKSMIDHIQKAWVPVLLKYADPKDNTELTVEEDEISMDDILNYD